MIAFIKAGHHGCQTPFKAIQDGTGRINVINLKRDPEFNKMFEEGWPFDRIDWRV